MPNTFDALSRQVRVTLAAIFANSAWRRIAFFLLPYAGVLVGLDVAAYYGALTGSPLPTQFFLKSDGGFGEYLEYSLTAAAAAMLFAMWLRTRAGLYLVNALLFVYLALDNALQFHERFGEWSAPVMPKGLPLGPEHVGEAALSVAIGAAWLIALVAALRTAQVRPAAHALILAACVAAEAFFGIIADAATSWGDKSVEALAFAAWIEDGGEFATIIATFLVTCAIFDMERRRGRAAQ